MNIERVCKLLGTPLEVGQVGKKCICPRCYSVQCPYDDMGHSAVLMVVGNDEVTFRCPICDKDRFGWNAIEVIKQIKKCSQAKAEEIFASIGE